MTPCCTDARNVGNGGGGDKNAVVMENIKPPRIVSYKKEMVY